MTELDTMIHQMRSLATFDEQLAKDAAPAVETALKKQVSAGKDPWGKAWKKKKDGGDPLVNAADSCTAEAVSDRIDLLVTGPEYWHQKAKPEGSLPRRQLIPDVGDPIPDHIQTAIAGVAEKTFKRVAGGS